MGIVRGVLDRPRAVFAVLVPLMVVAWFVSGVGDERTASEGGLYWVGAIAWAVFGITLVLTVVFAVITAVRLALRRSPTA